MHEGTDAYSGRTYFSLDPSVSPTKRSLAPTEAVEGWIYPLGLGPGQYRYLQLAVKATGSTMLTVEVDGRSFSAQLTPSDWQLLQIDLAEVFGGTFPADCYLTRLTFTSSSAKVAFDWILLGQTLGALDSYRRPA